MDMNYCMHCGTRLHMKEARGEGEVPFCDTCGEFRFPVFSTAVSMLVVNEDESKIILIEQYGKPFHMLCAGYVSKGEDAEDAAVREIKEELGLTVRKLRFNRSHYFAPSNTLMLNFTAIVKEEEAHPNWEIDSWRWYTIDEARNVKLGSLAAAFFRGYFDGVYEF